MSNMSNLDIVLSEHKLSDAQKNAVVELMEGAFKTTKPNTIKSLEKRGVIEASANVEGGWEFTDKFAGELGVFLAKNTDASESVESAESIESLLQGDPWKLGDAIVADEAYIILDSDGALKDAEGTEFDKFDDKWDDLLKVMAGFGATLDWRGTEVWNGLTAAEIKEDIETATPVNRNARRTHFRTLRNAFRRLNNKQASDSRKSLKITGKVGV